PQSRRVGLEINGYLPAEFRSRLMIAWPLGRCRCLHTSFWARHLQQISPPSSFFEDTAVRRLHIIKRTAPSLFQRFAQRRFLNDLIQQRTVVTRITTGV